MSLTGDAGGNYSLKETLVRAMDPIWTNDTMVWAVLVILLFGCTSHSLLPQNPLTGLSAAFAVYMSREWRGLIYTLSKFFFTFNAFTCVFPALDGFYKGVLTVRDIKCIGHWHFPWFARTHGYGDIHAAQFVLTISEWRQKHTHTHTHMNTFGKNHPYSEFISLRYFMARTL